MSECEHNRPVGPRRQWHQADQMRVNPEKLGSTDSEIGQQVIRDIDAVIAEARDKINKALNDKTAVVRDGLTRNGSVGYDPKSGDWKIKFNNGRNFSGPSLVGTEFPYFGDARVFDDCEDFQLDPDEDTWLEKGDRPPSPVINLPENEYAAWVARVVAVLTSIRAAYNIFTPASEETPKFLTAIKVLVQSYGNPAFPTQDPAPPRPEEPEEPEEPLDPLNPESVEEWAEWQTAHDQWELDYAQWELDYAQWEIDDAQWVLDWEALHDAWLAAKQAWEEENAAWIVLSDLLDESIRQVSDAVNSPAAVALRKSVIDGINKFLNSPGDRNVRNPEYVTALVLKVEALQKEVVEGRDATSQMVSMASALDLPEHLFDNWVNVPLLNPKNNENVPFYDNMWWWWLEVNAAAQVNAWNYFIGALGEELKIAANSLVSPPMRQVYLPEEFLICDGSEVRKDEYPELYAVIQDFYGKATSDERFRLPDRRGTQFSNALPVKDVQRAEPFSGVPAQGELEVPASILCRIAIVAKTRPAQKIYNKFRFEETGTKFSWRIDEETGTIVLIVPPGYDWIAVIPELPAWSMRVLVQGTTVVASGTARTAPATGWLTTGLNYNRGIYHVGMRTDVSSNHGALPAWPGSGHNSHRGQGYYTRNTFNCDIPAGFETLTWYAVHDADTQIIEVKKPFR